MNATVKEWLNKAEADYRTAQREFKAAESPNYDAACFHAHQWAEKLMKAILIHNEVLPPRTHNLEKLYGILKPLFPTLELATEDMKHLTTLAMAVRYPGETADRSDADQMLQICGRLRASLEPLVPRG